MSSRMGKILSSLFLAVAVTACGGGATSDKDDVLTQKVVPDGKLPVTVLVKYAFSINQFEKVIEAKFPQLDIIQIGNYTGERGMVEYDRRLEHDDLPDIIMTWPLGVGEQYWEDRLLDLSAMPFTSRYSMSMLKNIARDGKLYYLPGPAQVRGILYNKTLFEENGWQLPCDYKSFVELCQTIEKSGIRALQLGFRNPEVLDTAFVGYSYGPCFSTPATAQWLADFNDRKGSFGEHFGQALDIFQGMIDAGIWKKGDLEINYPARAQLFFSRKCAMVEDSVLLARMDESRTGSADEFALMPFFNPGTPSDWARLYMVCYIGLNKHLAEPKNQKKYDMVLQVMDYISTPEGQAALAADTGAMYSSLKNVPPPQIPEIAPLDATLRQGRYAIFPELKNAQDVLRRGLAGMIAGNLSKDDVIRMVDQQNQRALPTVSDSILSTATADFSLIETGNFLADAMRSQTGADVALFLDNGKDGRFNGKGISARFYEGPQTMADVFRVLPTLQQGEAGVLQIVTMTGENLRRTLEYAIPVNKDARGWFYYFSGLRMKYAPAAEPGRRIAKLMDEEGHEIESKRIYSIAIMDKTVPEDAVLSVQETGVLIRSLLADAMRAQGSMTPSGDRRFIVLPPSPSSR